MIFIYYARNKRKKERFRIDKIILKNTIKININLKKHVDSNTNL